MRFPLLAGSILLVATTASAAEREFTTRSSPNVVRDAACALDARAEGKPVAIRVDDQPCEASPDTSIIVSVRTHQSQDRTTVKLEMPGDEGTLTNLSAQLHASLPRLDTPSRPTEPLQKEIRSFPLIVAGGVLVTVGLSAALVSVVGLLTGPGCGLSSSFSIAPRSAPPCNAAPFVATGLLGLAGAAAGGGLIAIGSERVSVSPSVSTRGASANVSIRF